MAEAPAHKLGQIIGNLLEAVIEPHLLDFAKKKHLYLDHQRPREARKGKKVTWEDPYGNAHDLDYVLEMGGTETVRGTPVAFIEAAWRRYTKHSRNKAQEIQGAVLPLAEKFQWSNPFLGAVLAGVFTEGSLQQLRSHGFDVLYFPYDTLVAAFAEEGIDIAYDETTANTAFKRSIRKIDRSSRPKMERVKNHLVRANKQELEEFMSSLGQRFDRMVEKVVIIPLYGNSNEFATIHDAIEFLDRRTKDEDSGDFHKYEILITFSNGDRVDGSFKEETRARQFLQFIAKQ